MINIPRRFLVWISINWGTRSTDNFWAIIHSIWVLMFGHTLGRVQSD